MIMMKKYMKIKFNSDNRSPRNKTIEIHTRTIVIRAIFHDNNKYYPQVLEMNVYINYE